MSDAVAALRARLGTLLQQTGTSVREPAAAATPWDTEIEQVRRAQRARETARRRSEAALPGEELAPGVRCIRSFEPGLAAGPARAERATSPPPERATDAPWLYLDTETTGLAGGTGTLVFLIGIARHVDGGLLTEQWLLTRPSAEAAWIEAWQATLPRAATLVSYNGKAFDVPLLVARQCLARRRDPFAGYDHRDLLHEVRRAFAGRWADCRLQSAERRLLGRERIDDLPGAFAPAAFTSFVRHGAIDPLREVIRHNREDVVALARLRPVLDEVEMTPARFDAEAVAIARHRQRRGELAEAERVLREAGHDPNARRELARLLRRRGAWDDAASALEPLAAAAFPDPRALEALAKIAEHARGDPHGALQLAERLVALEPHAERHRRRLARLRRRCGVDRMRRDVAPSPHSPSGFDFP